MSLQAYQKTQARTENPRDTEFRLFALVTRALLDAEGEPRGSIKLVDAVDWNRRLWSTLATDCSDENNRLSAEVRAQIISLSLWVSRYSSHVIRNRATVEPLVEINRTIMQGLSGSDDRAAP
jgi:flagellar biosynthesis activator protein FlaF